MVHGLKQYRSLALAITLSANFRQRSCATIDTLPVRTTDGEASANHRFVINDCKTSLTVTS
jgi:hypothetical protein